MLSVAVPRGLQGGDVSYHYATVDGGTLRLAICDHCAEPKSASAVDSSGALPEKWTSESGKHRCPKCQPAKERSWQTRS